MSDADLESLLQRFPEGEPPMPDRRDELRQRVLDEFESSRRREDASFPRRLWKKGKRIVLHPVTRVATLTVAALIALSFWTPIPARAAFAQLIKPLVDAKSVKFRSVATIEIPGQKEVVFN